MGVLLSSSIGDHSVSSTALISWQLVDSLTSKVSTAPYSVADMQTMSDIFDKTKGTFIFHGSQDLWQWFIADFGPENPDLICSVGNEETTRSRNAEINNVTHPPQLECFLCVVCLPPFDTIPLWSCAFQSSGGLYISMDKKLLVRVGTRAFTRTAVTSVRNLFGFYPWSCSSPRMFICGNWEGCGRMS
jgi:hypothetical protein